MENSQNEEDGTGINPSNSVSVNNTGYKANRLDFSRLGPCHRNIVNTKVCFAFIIN